MRVLLNSRTKAYWVNAGLSKSPSRNRGLRCCSPCCSYWNTGNTYTVRSSQERFKAPTVYDFGSGSGETNWQFVVVLGGKQLHFWWCHQLQIWSNYSWRSLKVILEVEWQFVRNHIQVTWDMLCNLSKVAPWQWAIERSLSQTSLLVYASNNCRIVHDNQNIMALTQMFESFLGQSKCFSYRKFMCHLPFLGLTKCLLKSNLSSEYPNLCLMHLLRFEEHTKGIKWLVRH